MGIHSSWKRTLRDRRIRDDLIKASKTLNGINNFIRSTGLNLQSLNYSCLALDRRYPSETKFSATSVATSAATSMATSATMSASAATSAVFYAAANAAVQIARD